jgi:hypothetical protein
MAPGAERVTVAFPPRLCAAAVAWLIHQQKVTATAHKIEETV